MYHVLKTLKATNKAIIFIFLSSVF